MNAQEIADGLTAAQRRAYLTAGPRWRAADPDSLFITDSRGCKNLPGTIVTLSGLMLTPLGLEVRRILESQ